MNENLAAQLGMIVLALLLPYPASPDAKEFKARDGSRVLIQPIGKPSSHRDSESRLEFYSQQNQMLCALDYSSDDGEHGFGVVKASWTPDNNYFVFSLTSSGGHQAWHAPTLFYSLRDNSIHSLDSYVDAAGISKGDFGLKAPNTVLTEIWRGNSAPIELRLDTLPTPVRTPHVLKCSDGKIIRGEG